MNKAILILTALALVAGGCKQEKRQEQAEKKVKYYYADHSGSGTDAEFFDDGTCVIDAPSLHTPQTATYKEYQTHLLIRHQNGQDEEWKLFGDGGIIDERWKIVNYQKITSPIQITDYEAEQKQSERNVKYYFNTFLRPHADYRKDHIGVFYDDGTVYSCYDSESCNYEQNKKPEEREPNDRYTERPTLLYIGKLEDWNFFSDFGHIHAGWEIINHYRVYSPLQITNLISDLSKENLSQDDNVQHIENTCLIFITPENGYEEWMWYQDDRRKEYAEKGIPSIDAKERYLSFRLFDGSQISIDVKKEQNGISPSALLYRNGYIPIIISISGESEEGMERIENYLSESGDGGLPFERWSTLKD